MKAKRIVYLEAVDAPSQRLLDNLPWHETYNEFSNVVRIFRTDVPELSPIPEVAELFVLFKEHPEADFIDFTAP